MSRVLLDAGPPRNTGRRDRAELPIVLEIIAVMRWAGMGAWAWEQLQHAGAEVVRVKV